ncbi:MAG TPA: zinc ribbon domain-containing protein [Phycisphaerae bacterium]|nr:zinc ribbon domain-containing protein [Phycisphaerae bacterium]
MPIYEYQCLTCGKDFEQFTHAMQDPANLACTHCGSTQVERQLSVFAARQSEVEGRSSCGGCCEPSPDAPCCPYRADMGGCC